MPAHIAQDSSNRNDSPRVKLGWLRLAAFVFVSLIGIGFSVYLARIVRDGQQAEFVSVIQPKCLQVTSNIRDNISNSFLALDWIAMSASDPQFSRERFDQISRRTLDTCYYIQELRFVPMVTAAELPAFEQRMRKQIGPGFRVTDYETGRSEKPPKHEVYFPIAYCASRGNEAPLLGYNVDSNAQSHEAMIRARDTGLPTLHNWSKVTDNDFSYIVFVPVYSESTRQSPRRLIGYIQAVVSATRMIEAFVKRSDLAGLAFEIRDFGSPRLESIYRLRDGQASPISNQDWYATEPVSRTNIRIGDLQWRLNFWLTQSRNLADQWRMWSLPGLILVISVLIGYYFIYSSIHSHKMEEIVVRRTHELSDTNRELSREVNVRQLTELALRDNEARLEGILNSMADSWVMVYDAEFRCESFWIPSELEARYDLNKENIVGRPIQEISPACLAEQRIENVRQVLELGDNLRIEFLMELPHAEFWVEAAMSPLRDARGQINAVICLMRDVSERKRADQALGESEARYRGMVESQVDMVVRIDPRGRLTFVNDAYCSKAGLASEQLIGKPEITMVHEADRAAAETSISKLMQPPHERSSREQRMMTVQGVRWVHWESAAVLDEKNGRLVEVQSVGRDITERRQAEQEHLLLAEAVEQAAEAIFITDLEGVIQYVNPAFEHITGYARSEVMGTPHQILRRDLMNNDFYRKLWKTLEAGNIWRGHFTNRRKDGTVFDQLATISPVHDATGMITHFVSVELDMTNEKRLERQLRQAERLATIGQTIAGIAHRLKNISALIRGSATLLDQAVSREDMQSIKRLWPIFPRNSERLANLANDMLNFARVHDLNLQPIDLNDMLRKLCEEYAASARQRGVELKLDHVAALPQVRCDQKKIHDCVLNLVQNAVESCESMKGCTVSIATLCEDSQAVIEISDDGPGIPPDVLPHIYEPFFSTKEEKGTGLGLPMTQKTIHGHGGSIKVQSQPGHTVFDIYLPLGELANAEDMATADSARPEA